MADGGQQTGFLAGISPEQAVLLAGLFAIAVADNRSNDELSTLILFFSTVTSNIELIQSARSGGTTAAPPVIL